MRALGLAVGWAMILTILWLSLTPAPPQLDVSFGDKIGHFAAYGGVMYWFCKLYVRKKTRIGLAAAFVAMGVAIEFIQGATGYRSFELLDMLANTAGVLFGWTAAAFIQIPRRAQ
jgi:VanZ family protein